MSLLPPSRRPRWFSAAALAAAPPLVKLCVLGLAVAAVSVMVQTTAWGLGLDFWVLNKSASGFLIATTLTLLLMLVAIEGRPMADYGVIAEANWRSTAAAGCCWASSLIAGTSRSRGC